MTECIICEKPSSAKKIASFLADGKPKEQMKTSNGKTVKYYELTRNGKPILVVSAVGHLFTTQGKNPKNYEYPDFEYHWIPTYRDKKTAYTKIYYDTIAELSKKCKEFTIATDFDIEGEVIGYTILSNICKRTQASRMKYSCLTKPDITASYDNKIPHLLQGKIDSGLARHEIDWLYGNNMSRALMKAVAASGGYKSMSFGRVQGPTLRLIVDHENEIRVFKPEPYWQIQILLANTVIANHEADRFTDKGKCDEAFQRVKKAKEAIVTDLQTKNIKVSPPHPFDLTSLQTEAYKCLAFDPNATKTYAQNLYLASMISYPRTSSQKIPDNIDCRSIIGNLSDQEEFQDICNTLLATKGDLRPNNGKKEDEAHPAIHPTGLFSNNIQNTPHESMQLYELIVRRFLASFGEPAKRASTTVSFDVNGETFVSKGIVTIEPGWFTIYGKFNERDETDLPVMSIDDRIGIHKREMLEKETQPPGRYTESSLIKLLEKKKLGTKSTRSEVIAKLIDRGYIVVKDKSIVATDFGIMVISTCLKHAPDMCDETMTRDLEKMMERIERGKLGKDELISEAKKNLKKILGVFKSQEMEIGQEMTNASKKSNEAESLGTCPLCTKGCLYLKKIKTGKFVACSEYPACNNTYSVPKNSVVKMSKKQCEKCGLTMINVSKSLTKEQRAELKQQKKRNKTEDMCFNTDCKGGIPKADLQKLKEQCDKVCKCGNRMRIVAGSYGQFYGCTNYPKCTNKEPFVEEGAEVKKCDKCGKQMIKKNGKFGPFYGCIGFPECRNILRDGQTSNNTTATNVKCDQCGKCMVERRGPTGTFYGCTGYPNCRGTKQVATTTEKQQSRQVMHRVNDSDEGEDFDIGMSKDLDRMDSDPEEEEPRIKKKKKESEEKPKKKKKESEESKKKKKKSEEEPRKKKESDEEPRKKKSGNKSK